MVEFKIKTRGEAYAREWLDANDGLLEHWLTRTISTCDRDAVRENMMEFPEVTMVILKDMKVKNHEKWKNIMHHILSKAGKTIMIVGDRGSGKDVIIHTIAELLYIAKMMRDNEFDKHMLIKESMRDMGISGTYLKDYYYDAIKVAKQMKNWVRKDGCSMIPDNNVWIGEKNDFLPDWFTVERGVANAPGNAMCYVNEAAILMSAFRSTSKSQVTQIFQMAVARHQDQALIMATQSSALVNKSFMRFCDIEMFKYMRPSHLAFGRKEIESNPIAMRMFPNEPNDPRQTFVNCEDIYLTRCSNWLPSYWCESLSKIMTKITDESEAHRYIQTLMNMGQSEKDIILNCDSRGWQKPPIWWEKAFEKCFKGETDEKK